MSAFTMPLKEAIVLCGGEITFVNGVARMTGGDIGLNDYPLDGSVDRDYLNGKIIDHYFNREIGMESLGVWRQAMRRRMNEVMPLMNQYYKTAQLTYDPFSTIDIQTVAAGTTEQSSNSVGTAESTAENLASSRSVASDTPQTQLAGDEDYATSAADANSSSNGTTAASDERTNTENLESSTDTHVSGYQGVPADLLMRYREAFINTDLMVINSLEDCFMQVWDNGDVYRNR